MKPSLFRTRLYYLCFLVWTAFVCVFGLWTTLLPRRWLNRVIIVWGYSVSWLEKQILGLTYQVKGVENLPQGACIVAAKHESMWETCKMFGILGDAAIVLKAELTRLPILKWYASASGMIPIDRGGRVKTLSIMMKAAHAAAEEGRKIVIFPQGTRVPPLEKRPYRTGIAGIYQELELPIVPLALNSGLYWSKGEKIIKSGVITMEFLPPIPAGLPRQEMMKRLEEALETASDRLAKQG
jgi:1-acyl-sn-glycerol-3-phosphate acyltransferase